MLRLQGSKPLKLGVKRVRWKERRKQFPEAPFLPSFPWYIDNNGLLNDILHIEPFATNFVMHVYVMHMRTDVIVRH